MSIEILNKHNLDNTQKYNYIINIMSPNILSNPFVRNKKNREGLDIILDKYNTYLQENYKQNFLLTREIDKIKNLSKNNKVALLCCCKPNPCHGDILKDFIQSTE